MKIPHLIPLPSKSELEKAIQLAQERKLERMNLPVKENIKPDASYTKLQCELRTLIMRGDQSARRWRIQRKLESKFMAAWHFFTLDRRRIGARPRDTVHIGLNGLDHCMRYTGANDERVIVTQPYGDCEAELGGGLKLDDGMNPEIIVATEWAFHNPGRTALIILIFPSGYTDKLNQQ